MRGAMGEDLVAPRAWHAFASCDYVLGSVRICWSSRHAIHPRRATPRTSTAHNRSRCVGISSEGRSAAGPARSNGSPTLAGETRDAEPTLGTLRRTVDGLSPAGSAV